MRTSFILVALVALCGLNACKKPAEENTPAPQAGDTSAPTPYKLVAPPGFPAIKIPADNPLTVEGIALGKKLFFDKILSIDNSVSCGSCHKQNLAFVDGERFSAGVNAAAGTRNAMPLFNLSWAELFNPTPNRIMWDGKAATLEEQVLLPIINPVELGHNYYELEKILNAHPDYPALFEAAFGPGPITIKRVAYAIAQFERTLISSNSKFDKYKRNELSLTEQEMRGLNVFTLETKGGCFHCHGNDRSPFFTDFRLHNNGLDSFPSDLGLGALTKEPSDRGLFKAPSLRNLAFTAPYMHDGRFRTLDEVIEHYNNGVEVGPTTDVNLVQHVKNGGLHLTPQDKADLLAFLNTLNDYEFLVDERFKE